MGRAANYEELQAQISELEERFGATDLLGGLCTLEAVAAGQMMYSQSLVAGRLQTADYFHAIASRDTDMSDEERDMRWGIRESRAALWRARHEEDDFPAFKLFLAEQAVYNNGVCPIEVHQRQMNYLLECAESGQVELQIVPNTAIALPDFAPADVETAEVFYNDERQPIGATMEAKNFSDSIWTQTPCDEMYGIEKSVHGLKRYAFSTSFSLDVVHAIGRDAL